MCLFVVVVDDDDNEKSASDLCSLISVPYSSTFIGLHWDVAEFKQIVQYVKELRCDSRSRWFSISPLLSTTQSHLTCTVSK